MEMLVWQLRCDGVKLSKEDLEAPTRGWLRLGRLTVAGELTLHADLYASISEGAPPLLPGLSHVEVRKLDERGILLHGRQRVGVGAHTNNWPQAWFCEPTARST
ncbi:MAG TPA: hypothetical protein VGE36_13855 [Roseateles sp.]